eukprot:CAMPEP_0198364684 /NCGR_PEP_ID=MMETSP1450-20131203/153790_1 /TAXON_ID=753684 ORGANISM="Madagascaria erythrocladiodes, Strain CCMP3234" /NCGR_SAMPLE_ID=MMETSP1450 /ASSEMBLY_ACC=CAM_ASM_001115 /LENGTH=569 /DNA_ID=CAMNT_0044072123 /DNA_START=483 /DNA_END=2192 /DNA_ORIENTATION=+
MRPRKYASLLVLAAFVLLSSTAAMEFRTIDGTGNTNDDSGARDSLLKRLGPATYADGISEPRGGGIDEPLSVPGARKVSNNIVMEAFDGVKEPTGLSNFFWAFAQFLDHDIDLTTENEHERFDIPVPFNDPKFSGDLDALPFKRSKSTGGSPGKQREHFNDITSFIDASQVYGSDEGLASSLRVGGDGCLLETSEGNLLKWNPSAPRGGDFVAGDSRASENPALTSVHVLFLREHNRIAEQFLDDGMDDETCYQLTRLLVGAELQIITLNEFLPKLVGPSIKNKNFGTQNKNVGVFHEFSTVCFRFGHTMVPDELSLVDEDFCGAESISLTEAFHNPSIVRENGIEPIIRGLLIDSAEMLDSQLTDSLRNNLFQRKNGIEPIIRGLLIDSAEMLDSQLTDSLRNNLFQGLSGTPFGVDLAAFNIQRARDHGVSTYCETRKALGLKYKRLRVSDMTKNRQVERVLRNTYGADTCKIDPWVACLAEDRASDAIIGPTCQRMITRQFTDLFEGDRFFFEKMDWTTYGLSADPTLAPGLKLSKVKLANIIELNTGITGVGDPFQADATLTSGC